MVTCSSLLASFRRASCLGFLTGFFGFFFFCLCFFCTFSFDHTAQPGSPPGSRSLIASDTVEPGLTHGKARVLVAIGFCFSFVPC